MTDTTSRDQRNAPTHRCAGFTLIELLVAMGVTLVLLVMVFTVLSSGAGASSAIMDKLTTRSNAEFAFDFLERDLDGLTPPERARTTLTLRPETVDGIASFWIMMLSRPMAGIDPGALQAISYRLVDKDPMTPAGTDLRVSMYRTRLARPPATLSFLDKDDLHDGFWSGYWPAYTTDDGGRTLLEDYLADNIVDVQVRLTYNYLDEKNLADPTDDEVVWVEELPVTATINLTDNGFNGTDIEADHVPNTPISITVSVSSLRREEASLYRQGGLSLGDAIDQGGVTFSRTYPLLTVYR